MEPEKKETKIQQQQVSQLRHQHLRSQPQGFRDRLIYPRSQVNVHKLTKTFKINLRRLDQQRIERFMQLARSFQNRENVAVTISLNLSSENETTLSQIRNNISQLMPQEDNKIFASIDTQYLQQQFEFPINQRLQQNLREQIETIQNSSESLKRQVQLIIDHFRNNAPQLSSQKQYFSDIQKQAGQTAQQQYILKKFKQLLQEVKEIQRQSIQLTVIISQRRINPRID